MYSKEQVETVCRLLEDEGLSLCKALERESLTKGQFFRTIEADPELADQYTRARSRLAELYAEEIIEIADTEEDSAKARVRIDARKWVASKLLPKKYGEKVEQEQTGRVEIVYVGKEPK